jgi:hypothetical protein
MQNVLVDLLFEVTLLTHTGAAQGLLAVVMGICDSDGIFTSHTTNF